MAFRSFLRNLFRPLRPRRRLPGDDLAESIREGMGPTGGGDGRLTGSAIYRHLGGDDA